MQYKYSDKTFIEAPPHPHTINATCKACEKWLEYQKLWYFDLEHNFNEVGWRNIQTGL